MKSHDLLTIEVKPPDTGFAGADQKHFRDAGLIVREHVAACGFSGHWLLRHRERIRQKNPRRCKFIAVRGHAIRVRVKPAGNDSCHEYDLSPPTNYDAETAFVSLVNATVPELLRRERGVRGIVQRMQARDARAIPRNVPPDGSGVGDPAEPQNFEQQPQPQNGVSDTMPQEPDSTSAPVTPAPAAMPKADLLAAFKQLLDQASREETRRERLEKLQARAAELQAEIADLQAELAAVEAEQLMILEEEDADGGAEARVILDGLQKLALKSKPR